jgi:hypothetical protein
VRHNVYQLTETTFSRDDTVMWHRFSRKSASSNRQYRSETSPEQSNASAYESSTFLIPSSLPLAYPGPFSSDYLRCEPTTTSGTTSSIFNSVSMNGVLPREEDRGSSAKFQRLRQFTHIGKGQMILIILSNFGIVQIVLAAGFRDLNSQCLRWRGDWPTPEVGNTRKTEGQSLRDLSRVAGKFVLPGFYCSTSFFK